MLMPLNQIELNLSRPDQFLMYHLVTQQLETNRLLSILIGEKTVSKEAVNIDELKRPELMKLMSKTTAKGWNKWSNESIIKYLKEVG